MLAFFFELKYFINQLMKLGFIGIGNIASDVIEGFVRSQIKYSRIIISPRNKTKSKNLKKKFKRIVIAKNNQQVIDGSDLVFLSILPNVALKILPNLKFKKNQTIVSFISTLKYLSLEKIINTNVKIVRAIPMPPIRLGKGPVIIFPPNQKVKKLFNNVGHTIEIKDENLSNGFWAISGTMASFYELINILSNWLTKNKINRYQSQEYVANLYTALSNLALKSSKKNFENLVDESQTPGGLNWQVLKDLKKQGHFRVIEKSLNKLILRLKKSK